jgi:transcription initiation factor IIE alpha subunit
MDKETRSPAVVILIGTVLGVGYCLWKITQSPTANESLLLSLFMTLLSVLASWIVSRFYAKASYEDNLKVFALKAAEKVTNLSTQLDRLSAFLQKAIDEDDFSSPTEELLAKSIRFEDAIHLITALKSFNDTSLSDWRGIIGNELSAQREAQRAEQEEREEQLQAIMERLELIQRESTDSVNLQEKAERERLRSELAALRGDMRDLASQVGGVSFRTPFKRKVTVEKQCPRCSAVLQYQQSIKGVTTKKIDCPHCSARLYAQLEGTESVLRERVPIPETVVCPACSAVETQNIDPLLGAMQEYECSRCHAQLRAVRSKKEITVRPNSTQDLLAKVTMTEDELPSTHDLPAELLESIAEHMGQQPWPKGKAQEVRFALGLSRATLEFGIRQLIARGKFRPQVDGILYRPIDADVKN